ncbi:unnamed protein product [Musa textilis]
MEELPLHPRGKMAKVARNVRHQMFARHDQRNLEMALRRWLRTQTRRENLVDRPSSGTNEGDDLEPEAASCHREREGHFLNPRRFGPATGKKRGSTVVRYPIMKRGSSMDSGDLSVPCLRFIVRSLSTLQLCA